MSAVILETILFLVLSHQLVVVVVKHGMWEVQILMVALVAEVVQTQPLADLVLLVRVMLAEQV